MLQSAEGHALGHVPLSLGTQSAGLRQAPEVFHPARDLSVPQLGALCGADFALRDFSLARYKLTGTRPVRTMGSVWDNEVATLRIGLSQADFSYGTQTSEAARMQAGG
jgi:hypothetical protein